MAVCVCLIHYSRISAAEADQEHIQRVREKTGDQQQQRSLMRVVAGEKHM